MFKEYTEKNKCNMNSNQEQVPQQNDNVEAAVQPTERATSGASSCKFYSCFFCFIIVLFLLLALGVLVVYEFKIPLFPV
ncbi:hypothetical protein Ddc_14173 [Ditylenchus destructor]|nr:hypothetical protein Ddc_14173 [Ditylenchus destructor]